MIHYTGCSASKCSIGIVPKGHDSNIGDIRRQVVLNPHRFGIGMSPAFNWVSIQAVNGNNARNISPASPCDKEQPYSALNSPLAPLAAGHGCTIFKPILNLNWQTNCHSLKKLVLSNHLSSSAQGRDYVRDVPPFPYFYFMLTLVLGISSANRQEQCFLFPALQALLSITIAGAWGHKNIQA